MSFVSFDLILASTHTRSDDADGDGLNSRLYIYIQDIGIYMFLFSFHAHTLMRDLKTLFVFVVFFSLGLKNFISPLFCWTVA